MIGIHAGIYGGVLVLYVLLKRQLWRPSLLKEARIRTMVLAVILGANTLGCVMSVQELWKQKQEVPRQIAKGEGLAKEQAYLVGNGEEEWEIGVLVPAKEEPQESSHEVAEPSPEDSLKQAVSEYNEEQKDPDYYYLPDEWQGETLVWKRPVDRAGTYLAGMGVLGAILLAVLSQKEEESERRKREEAALKDYPDFIMQFTLLMKAGMTFRNAFARMAADGALSGKRDSGTVYGAVTTACRELESGVAEAEVYEHFAQHCGQVKYRTFAALLTQNLRKGSSGMLEILERESLEAWEERKRKARVEGEKAVTRLLLPMILMMILVMVLILVPAFLSFYGNW